VERLRAAGLKGVQRITIEDKDYNINLDTSKTGQGAGEWLGAGSSLPLVYAAIHP
jgi:hypothetical protein